MKLLIINNNLMLEGEDKKLYVHNSYGHFLEELSIVSENLIFFQFKGTSKNISLDNYYCLSNNKNIKIIALNQYKTKSISYLIAYCYGIILLFRVDVLYLFFPNNFKYLGFIAKFLKKKLGLYIRGQHGIKTTVPKILYKKSDVVLTVSPGFTKIVNELGGNAFTIYPMISYSCKDIVNNREYKSKKEFKILYLGRIEFDKGLRELLYAIRQIVNGGVNNFHVNIVGDGNNLDEIKNLSASLDINNIVTFMGNESDYNKIKNYYLNSDIYILPSYHEGFPRTLYEAMIFGTPIISTMVGGIPYIMKPNFNCFEIEPKSIDSIYKTIIYILKNYEQIRHIPQNATKSIKEYLSENSLSHSKLIIKHLQK